MTAKLYGAMAKAFHAIEGASKDKTNPHFKTKYADLESVVGAIKPALASQDLWFRQVTSLEAGGVCIETIICHASGEEVSCGKLFVPANKNDAQAYGSALSYARRYSLMTAFGVCPEDDDGNDAAKSAPQAQEPERISKAQWTRIVALLESTNTNAAPILTHFKVDDLKKLTAAQAIKAINQLEDKLSTMAKEESNKTLADELGDEVPF